MSHNRVFIASLDITTADGTVAGEAIVKHAIPRGTKITLEGEVKESGARRWIELKSDMVERTTPRRLKRSQYLAQTRAENERLDK